MRHRKNSIKLGRTGAHKRALLSNQVCSLIYSGQVKTTVPKAKAVKRFAEKMVSFGKLGDLHHRRLAVSRLHDKDAVRILFDEIAPRYSGRPGGYTRIIRLGQRIGDAADMCILQWVEEEMVSKPSKKKKKKPEKKSAPEKKEDKPAEAAAGEERGEAESEDKTETPAAEQALEKETAEKKPETETGEGESASEETAEEVNKGGAAEQEAQDDSEKQGKSGKES